MNLTEKLRKFLKGIEPKEKTITADEAYYRSKYGAYRTTEQMIKDEQRRIRDAIKYKLSPSIGVGRRPSDYCILISFDDDMKEHVQGILAPFINDGYKVLDLQKEVKELKGELLYIISWRKDNLA